MTGAGFPHSDICGSKVGRHLPAAFRSHPRPLSVLDAKAFTVGSLYLGRYKMLVLALKLLRNIATSEYELRRRRSEWIAPFGLPCRVTKHESLAVWHGNHQ